MSEWTECHSSVTYALLVPVVYVGLTRLSSYDVPHWDRHRTILRRFVGASFASILLSIVALRWKPENQSALEFFGLRRPGLFLALILPTSVTAVLFLGPWCLSLFVGPPSDDDEEDSFVMLLRNYLLAPLTEELVFRCCALRVMTMCMPWTKACLISPLSFAFAHCHHALEKKRLGYNWQDILCTVGFQVGFCYLFGVYVSLIYLRTRHLMAAFMCHVFCNFMGFPDISLLKLVDRKKRSFVILCFVIGVLLWISLFLPFTEPWLYENKV
uniref:CAAX prenyl protease 2 n=1 Tax=Trichuris muris TaxID=70415 RepID=A0A5S6R4C8_TRIMR